MCKLPRLNCWDREEMVSGWRCIPCTEVHPGSSQGLRKIPEQRDLGGTGIYGESRIPPGSRGGFLWLEGMQPCRAWVRGSVGDPGWPSKGLAGVQQDGALERYCSGHIAGVLADKLRVLRSAD